MKKIMLNKKNLTDLMKGRALAFGDVQIALGDIGYTAMKKAWTEAYLEHIHKVCDPDSEVNPVDEDG